MRLLKNTAERVALRGSTTPGDANIEEAHAGSSRSPEIKETNKQKGKGTIRQEEY